MHSMQKKGTFLCTKRLYLPIIHFFHSEMNSKLLLIFILAVAVSVPHNINPMFVNRKHHSLFNPLETLRVKNGLADRILLLKWY